MKCKTAFFVFLLLCYAAAPAFAKEKIELKPGQEEFRKLDSIKRISVADPYIADAKVLSGGKQLMIRALNPGKTTVTVFDKNEKKTIFDIHVVSMMNEEARKIQALLKGVDTLHVRVIDDQVVIEGEIIRQKDLVPLKKVKELYKDIKILVSDKIKTSQEYIVRAMETELPSTISAKLLGDGVMLEGTVTSREEKNKAERIARDYVENVYSVLKIKAVSSAISVNPVEFTMQGSQLGPADKVLTEGLELEKGIFGIILQDEISSENMVQRLYDNFSASSAFDGIKEYTESGQYELALEGGEHVYVFFQIDLLKSDLYKVALSLLDGQKKVLLRKDFYAQRFEGIGVTGFYNALRKKGKMEKGDRELMLVFSLKN